MATGMEIQSVDGRASEAPPLPQAPLHLGSNGRVFQDTGGTCIAHGHRPGPTATSIADAAWSAAILHRIAARVLFAAPFEAIFATVSSTAPPSENDPSGSISFSKGILDRTTLRFNPNRASNTFDERYRC